MAMAQDFHGVTVTGTGHSHAIVNHSTKPLIGYAIQGHTTTGPKPVFGYVHTTAGLKPIFGRVDFGSVAAGKPIQPGEERQAAILSAFVCARPVHVGTETTWEEITADKEETLSYELTAVLFADGTFIGPDDVLADFSKQINTARSMARDTQYLGPDKYTALEQHEFLKAMRRLNASTDIQALVHRADVAFSILRIRDAKGEQEAEAALARLAALPDVRAVP